MITESARVVLNNALDKYNDGIEMTTARIRELETEAAGLKSELEYMKKNAREIKQTLDNP